VLLLGLAGAVVTPWGDAFAQQPGPKLSAREDEALDLVVQMSTSEDEHEQAALVKKLASYRFASVAQAIVQLLEDPEVPPSVVQEAEWTLTALSPLSLEPLTASLAQGRIPPDLAVLVLTRISRQDPSLVSPYLASDESVGVAAALALSASGHPESVGAIVAAYPGASASAKEAILSTICRVDSDACGGLVAGSLKSGDRRQVLAALGTVRFENLIDAVPGCVTHLHDPDPLVVRSALEALSSLGATGYEKDLAILFDGAGPGVQEAVLAVLASTHTSESSEILWGIVAKYPARSPLGLLARRLHAHGPHAIASGGRKSDSLPIEAVFWDSSPSRVTVVLHNAGGQRVVASGALAVRCPRRREARRKISASEFSPDGSLAVDCGCSDVSSPELIWERPGGGNVEAVWIAPPGPAGPRGTTP